METLATLSVLRFASRRLLFQEGQREAPEARTCCSGEAALSHTENMALFVAFLFLRGSCLTAELLKREIGPVAL